MNLAALLAVAAAVVVYYALPHASLKVVWGLAVGAVAYLALLPAQQTLLARSSEPQPGTGPA